MLKSGTETREFIIPMPVNPTYYVISVHEDRTVKELFIMIGITEKEYNKLKHGDNIDVKKGQQDFYVSPDDILCFGEIDFHEGSDDCKELDTFNWLDHLGGKGVGIPSRYNYDKHECSSPINKYLITETFRNSTLCRYIHGCLGKPHYTLIFRELV